MNARVRVEVPAHIARLAGTGHLIELAVAGAVTQRSVLDALEAAYPMLEGTLRDHATKLRRPFIRFFAREEDLSHLAPDDLLPSSVAEGSEPLLIVGAIAGG